MISFMADVIGIRDDMYIGKGHTYQKKLVGRRDPRATRTGFWSRSPPW